MCGLVGMAGDLQKEDRSMFKHLLIVDALRGHHSTGVMSVSPGGKPKVFKRAMNPLDLVQHREYDNTVDWDSQVLMGHNRYATVGKIDNHSAHPFEHGKMIGAHNGTLEQWYSLPAAKDFDVDSECLIFNLAYNGWQETIDKVYGAFALSVYDEKEHELHLVRNEERPLYLGYRLDGKALYWASESWMIRQMAARVGIKLQKNIGQLKPYEKFSWRLPDKKLDGIPEGTITKLNRAPEKKPWAPSQNHGALIVPTGGGAGQNHGAGDDKLSQYDKHAQKELGCKKGEVVEFVPTGVEYSSVSNLPYLAGVFPEEPWTTIRVFMDEKECEAVMAAEALFEGQVQSLVASPTGKGNDGYAILYPYSLKRTVDLEDAADEDYDDIVLVSGPDRRMIDRKKFETLVKHGCASCTGDLEFGDHVFWMDQAPLCEECWYEADLS